MQFLLLSWVLDQAAPQNHAGEEGEACVPCLHLHLPVRSLTLSFLQSLNLSTEAAGSVLPAPSVWWAPSPRPRPRTGIRGNLWTNPLS